MRTLEGGVFWKGFWVPVLTVLLVVSGSQYALSGDRKIEPDERLWEGLYWRTYENILDPEIDPELPEWEDYMDYGTNIALQENWARAIERYRTAARHAETNEEKAAALVMASQVAGVAEEYFEAGQLANEAHRLMPDRAELAGLRFIQWRRARTQVEEEEDSEVELLTAKLEEEIAYDHLKAMELSLEGEEVSLITAATIVVTAAIVGRVAMTIILRDKIDDPAEHIKQTMPLATNLLR